MSKKINKASLNLNISGFNVCKVHLWDYICLFRIFIGLGMLLPHLFTILCYFLYIYNRQQLYISRFL